MGKKCVANILHTNLQSVVLSVKSYIFGTEKFQNGILDMEHNVMFCCFHRMYYNTMNVMIKTKDCRKLNS